MTETYWNGLPTPAERVRVVVDTSPVHTWWCADLAGTERAAVRVGEPGGEVIYLDDEDGSGWWKVTEGRGSPQVPHRSLPVAREVQSMPTREQIDTAVGAVLFNVSNYPKPAQSHLWGRDVGPLREKVTAAVLALLTEGASR